MLNASSYRDTRRCLAPQNGGRKHAKQNSFKEPYFPFHRLPREIIAEIFVLCLPDFEDVYSSKSKNAAPPLLCSISSSWRLLALSIPRLWNELSIRIANPNPQMDIDLAVSMVESWIGRSGELPLSLRLSASAWNEKEQVGALVKVYLNTFFRYASRWGSVDITLFCGPAVSFPKSRFGPTPLLRKFSYSAAWRDRVPFPFTSCPLLSALSWPFSCSTVSNPEIPWHQLTHISMKTSIDTQEALDILQTCEVLVELIVKIYDDLSLDQLQSPRKPVENQSLRTFHIYATYSVLLKSLILPALTDFSLSDYDDPSTTSTLHTELLGLFARSKCNLEKLKLQDCDFNDAGILKCLQHDSCSSLTELEIISNYEYDDQPMLTDRVILALTNKDNLSEVNNVLLPKLSRLFLYNCVSASPGVLGDMVLSRCLWGDEDDQLKLLTLHVRDLDDTDRRYFKMAAKLGIKLNITTSDSDDQLEFIEDQSDIDDN